MNGLFINPLKSPYELYMDEGLLFYPTLFEGEELNRLRESCEYVLNAFLRHVDAKKPDERNVHVARALEQPLWHPKEKEQEHRLRLLETIADPRCLGPVEQIFRGPSLYRHCSLFFNPRFQSSEGNWHRDLQFVLPSEEEVKAAIGKQALVGVQLQIALLESEDVEYVPFSARRYDSPEEHYFRCADNRAHATEGGMPGAMRVRQRPGDAIIFNPNGLHRGRYYVDSPRRTLMLTYTPRGGPVRDDFSYLPWFLDPGYLEGLSPRATAYFEDFKSVYGDWWRSERHTPAFC